MTGYDRDPDHWGKPSEPVPRWVVPLFVAILVLIVISVVF